MKRSFTTYPIAVDLGDGHLYAVQLRKEGKGLALGGLLHRELPDLAVDIAETGDPLIPVLREAFRRRRFKGRRAVITLPAGELITIPLHFHVEETEGLEEAMVRAAEESISFPLEEAVLDYASLTSVPEGDADEYRATVIAAHRDTIARYVGAFKKAGLVVEAVDFDVSALIRLHTYLHDSLPEAVMLCNIGNRNTMLSIVTQESIVLQRQVSWGMLALFEKLVTNLEGLRDTRHAQFMLKTYGLAYEDRVEPPADEKSTVNILRAVYQIITPFMEELVYEFHKMISYARSEGQNPLIEEICLYGNAALIHHMDRYLERRLNLSVRILNPLAQFEPKRGTGAAESAEGAPWSVALGLALRRIAWL